MSDPATRGPEQPFLREDTSVSHSSLIVSSSFFVVALLGAGQALLIGLLEENRNHTDAFLAAYALYSIFVIFGSSLRASVIPVLGSAESDAHLRGRVSDVISHIIVLAFAALATLFVLSPVLGQAVARGLPSEARWTTVYSLLLLAPAAFCQICAAAQSASLSAARRFAFTSLWYIVAGALALAVSAVLLVAIGVLGAAIGLEAGAIVLMAGHSAYLRRFGLHFRPRLAWLRQRELWQLALRLIAGAALAISFQATLVVSLGVVSAEEGAITAYTYAFFIISLILGVTSSSLAFVTLPDLVGRVAREGVAAARDYLRTVVPYMFAVLVPLLAAFVAFGKPILEAIFGGSLSDGTIDLLYDIGVLLSALAVPAALLFLTSAATLALGRSQWFLAVGGASVAIHAAIVIPMSGLGPRAVAAGHIGSVCVMTALLMAATFGRGWPGLALKALARSAPAFALASVFALGRLPLGSDPSVGAAIAVAALCTVAYAVLAAVLWPSVGAAFVDLVRNPTARAGSAGAGD